MSTELDMDTLTLNESKAMRLRLIDALAMPGSTITNTDAALIGLAELLVQTALLTNDGNRARSRDLIGGLVDRLLDTLASDESIARMRSVHEKYPDPTIDELRAKGLVP